MDQKLEEMTHAHVEVGKNIKIVVVKTNNINNRIKEILKFYGRENI